MSKTQPEKAHKPSRKRTLEDVMSSLQDLVNNELSDAKLASRLPARPGDKNRSRDEAAPDHQTAADEPELAATPEAASAATDTTDPDRDPNTRDMFDEDNPFSDLEAALVRKGTLTRDDVSPAPKIQQADPDDRAEEDARSAEEALEDESIAASIEAAVEAALEQSTRKAAPAEPTKETARPADTIAKRENKGATPPPATPQHAGNNSAPVRRLTDDQLEIDWEDDIPVLHEVAAPPPRAPLLPAAVDAEPLPGNDRARDIAIRVIARLNIELRERGQPGLEPVLINRLQRVLREELAQHAPNMDNSADDQADH